MYLDLGRGYGPTGDALGFPQDKTFENRALLAMKC